MSTLAGMHPSRWLSGDFRFADFQRPLILVWPHDDPSKRIVTLPCAPDLRLMVINVSYGPKR